MLDPQQQQLKAIREAQSLAEIRSWGDLNVPAWIDLAVRQSITAQVESQEHFILAVENLESLIASEIPDNDPYFEESMNYYRWLVGDKGFEKNEAGQESPYRVERGVLTVAGRVDYARFRFRKILKKISELKPRKVKMLA